MIDKRSARKLRDLAAVSGEAVRRVGSVALVVFEDVVRRRRGDDDMGALCGKGLRGED